MLQHDYNYNSTVLETMQQGEQQDKETGGNGSSDEDMQSSVSSASMTSATLRAIIQEEMGTILGT